MKAYRITAMVQCNQLVRIAGTSLGSVRLSEDKHHLIVNRKRPRAGRFETCLYPIGQVMAYQEGTGGKEDGGSAFAVVRELVPMLNITGEGIIDINGWVRIVDEDGKAHSINSKDDGVFLTVSEQEEEQAKPRPKTRRI